MKHCVWLWEHSYGLTLPNAWSLVKEMHWITSYGLHFLLLLFYEVFEDKLFQNFSPTLQETVQSISIYSWLKHRKPLDASWLWGMFFATQNVHNNVSTVTGKARIVSSLLICATFANGIKRCTIVSVPVLLYSNSARRIGHCARRHANSISVLRMRTRNNGKIKKIGNNYYVFLVSL